MRIGIFTVGKWKQSPEQALYLHYIKRSRWNIGLHELTSQPHPIKAIQQESETQALLQAAKRWNAEAFFYLDETGKPVSSKQFADYFRKWQLDGIRNVACLIGGDVGLQKTMFQTSPELCFSFGQMTWPHLLVRPLLAEQLYRAECILSNHPYHRE